MPGVEFPPLFPAYFNQNSRVLLNLRKKDVSLKNKLLDAILMLITLFEKKKNNWKLFSDLRTEFNKKFKSKKKIIAWISSDYFELLDSK